MTPLAPHITAYPRQRLPVERAASPHTCDTYAHAFRLLFVFASRKLGVAPSALYLEHLDAPLVLEFLENLQTVRGNSPRTRNARLTAIKSFMRSRAAPARPRPSEPEDRPAARRPSHDRGMPAPPRRARSYDTGGHP